MGGERFEYRITKAGVVRIFRHGRCVQTVGGARALALVGKLEGATDEVAQDALRRFTGNFKRGNERGLGSDLPRREDSDAGAITENPAPSAAGDGP